VAASALDAERVSDVLRRHLSADATCTALHRGPVGNGQETWFLSVETPGGSQELVLRRTAEAGPLEWTERGAEATAMNAVASRGLPVPRVHWVQDDPAELDQPYLVMDRAPGAPVLLVDEASRPALVAALAVELARLHTEAVPAGGSGELDVVTATRAEIERWRSYYVEHRIAPIPLVGALFAWLDANVPDLAEEPAILVWGDAGAHNALCENGRITALLDWELAHAGHPLEDLGALVWMELDGGSDIEVIIAAYEAARGQPVDRAVLDFFVVLTCVTRAVMIQVGAGAFVAGRTTAPNLAGLGLDLPAVNLARAAALAGWGEVAPPAPPRPPEPPNALRPSGAEIDVGIARFLRDDVLPQITDRRTRRGVKTAAALLETAALRASTGAVVDRERAAQRPDLAARLAALGLDLSDLEGAAVRVETESDLADLRPLVRHHLLNDLACQRSLLAPLRILYGR
jgi:aminoglycoside phosphotransferase (APT) family kinase protein